MKTPMMLFTAAAAGLFLLGAGSLALQDEAAAPRQDEAPKVAEVGKKVPDFELKDLDGKTHKLSDHKGKVVILEWFNPECPFVVHIHQKDHPYKKWSNELHEHKDYVIFAINSGAPGEQGTGLEKNKRYQKEWNIKYPLLIDEDGEAGRAFEARRTPHMYLIDKEGVLRYVGAIDNAPLGRPTAGAEERISYIKRAFEQLKNGETVSPDTTREYGCTVKYVDHRERGRQPEQRERPQRGERPGRGGRGGGSGGD